MQSIEIYTPRKDPSGAVNGIDHEVVLYDAEALVEPVRIVQRWTKAGELNEGNPYQYLECVQYNYPVEGRATPIPPGTTIEYTVPDVYGRPWARIWERYFEQGMEHPEAEPLFGFE